MAKAHVLLEGETFYAGILIRGKEEVFRYSHEDPMKVALAIDNFGIKADECSFCLPERKARLNPKYTLKLDELPEWRKERFHEALRLLQTY